MEYSSFKTKPLLLPYDNAPRVLVSAGHYDHLTA